MWLADAATVLCLAKNAAASVAGGGACLASTAGDPAIAWYALASLYAAAALLACATWRRPQAAALSQALGWLGFGLTTGLALGGGDPTGSAGGTCIPAHDWMALALCFAARAACQPGAAATAASAVDAAATASAASASHDPSAPTRDNPHFAVGVSIYSVYRVQ